MASHTTTAVFQRGGIAGRPTVSAFVGLVEFVVATRDPSFHPLPFACKRVRAEHRVVKGREVLFKRADEPDIEAARSHGPRRAHGVGRAGEARLGRGLSEGGRNWLALQEARHTRPTRARGRLMNTGRTRGMPLAPPTFAERRAHT
jgi:hypothetical protein